MNASYVNTLDFQFFSPALDHFNAMIQHLESAHLQDHGKTEEYIRTDGDELPRLMFQGYLDKQAEDEEKAESVTASDGISRNHVRQNTSRVLIPIPFSNYETTAQAREHKLRNRPASALTPA